MGTEASCLPRSMLVVLIAVLLATVVCCLDEANPARVWPLIYFTGRKWHDHIRAPQLADSLHVRHLHILPLWNLNLPRESSWTQWASACRGRPGGPRLVLWGAVPPSVCVRPWSSPVPAGAHRWAAFFKHDIRSYFCTLIACRKDLSIHISLPFSYCEVPFFKRNIHIFSLFLCIHCAVSFNQI